jgi:hypothetical protein
MLLGQVYMCHTHHRLRIKRAPGLALWAVVVAEHLGSRADCLKLRSSVSS